MNKNQKDQMMTDIITYADEVLSLLDVLKAMDFGSLTALDSIKIVTETAYNVAESLYDCISDLHLEFIKEVQNDQARD